MNCLLFSFLKTLYFCYYSMVFYQYMTYYIPLESSDLPLSNGIVVKVKFPYILYLLNLLFKYLIYLQCNQCYSKYQNIAGNVRYLIARYLVAHVVLLRTNNQELCSATLGPHLYFLIRWQMTHAVRMVLSPQAVFLLMKVGLFLGRDSH